MTARSDRIPFAYVVAIEGVVVRLNIRDAAHGRRSSVRGTTSPTLKVGARFGILSAGRVLAAEVQDLAFLDPVKARAREISSETAAEPPLRQLRATILGRFEVSSGGSEELQFVPGGLDAPALGDSAVPLDDPQLRAMLTHEGEGSFEVGIAADTHHPVRVRLNDLLARHIAVLGSTGQGKTSLVARLLQGLRRSYPSMRCVVFDVHGEYAKALPDLCRVSRFGVSDEVPDRAEPIPYPVLGEDGLEALIDPSDKAQRPALRFALAKLPFVEWHESGAGIAGSGAETLFSDCRQDDSAKAAQQSIQQLQETPARGSRWPNMRALGALAAEFWSLQATSRYDWSAKEHVATVQRDGFRYGHVAALVRRVEQLVDDPEFTNIVNCDPGTSVPADGDAFRLHRRDWVESFFGLGGDAGLHVVDLRAVSHAYLPFVLSGMMSALLRTIVENGQGSDRPLMLVLEEAHQFARRGALTTDNSRELLPYERLAKEGRKFGVSLLVSSQRPSEVSETVLAQCGTWFCLRLASESDRERVRHASEWADRTLLQRIVALPKHEAIAFGSPFRVPVHLRLRKPDPWHDAEDSKFHEKWSRTNRGADTGTPDAS